MMDSIIALNYAKSSVVGERLGYRCFEPTMWSLSTTQVVEQVLPLEVLCLRGYHGRCTQRPT